MQVRREVVTSPNGARFVVAYAPSQGIDTSDFYTGVLFRLRRWALVIELASWVRHRLKGKGRWTVASARLGANGKASELVHSSYEADRRSARESARMVRERIRAGELT